MKESIKYLKRDRKVNKAFKEKLEKEIGLEVEYGKFAYWDNQEYVEIGRQRVWLVDTYTENNSSYVGYKFQNDVIEEIQCAIGEEMQLAERADATVKDFFEKLNA